MHSRLHASRVCVVGLDRCPSQPCFCHKRVVAGAVCAVQALFGELSPDVMVLTVLYSLAGGYRRDWVAVQAGTWLSFQIQHGGADHTLQCWCS